MPVTFKVDDVKPGHYYDHLEFYKRPDDKMRAQFLKQGLGPVGVKGGSVEGYKFNTVAPIQFGNVKRNSFMEMCMTAFDSHLPITFAPEDIWLVIGNALTKHIELNSEAVKHALGVTWEGKKTLLVVANDFVKGSPTNNWERVFGTFSDQIESHLGKKRDLLDPSFSTTTPTEKAAIQVQLMAALAPYFTYSMRTCCGVPTVTLLGEPDDWLSIVTRVQALGEIYPSWGHQILLETVNEFYAASKGNPDLDFWKNFFKRSGGSGATLVNGYINAFFPYVKGKQNHLMKPGASFRDEVRKSAHSGNDIGNYGSSVCAVPMLWTYYDTEYPMKLVSGIFGFHIYEDTFKATVGWLVGEEKADTNDEPRTSP